MRFEFLRKDITFIAVIGEGNFGRIWHAKAKGMKDFRPRDRGSTNGGFSTVENLEDTIVLF